MAAREKLSDEAIADFLRKHEHFRREGDALLRVYTFPDYASALAFVVRVSMAAEKRDHHPDVRFGWGRAEILWTTHDRGGITDLDVEMSKATEKLYGGE